MVGVTEELHFYFYLILINLNNHMWLMVTMLDNITLEQFNYILLFIRNCSEIILIIFFIKDRGKSKMSYG